MSRAWLPPSALAASLLVAAPAASRAAPAAPVPAPRLQSTALRLDHGAVWRVRRDPAAPGQPVRSATGPGLYLVAHPGPDAAELDAVSRGFLDCHAEFGAVSRDLDLVAVRPVGDLHSVVAYGQRRAGHPVLGARIDLVYRGPALVVVGSTAVPAATPTSAGFALDRAAARRAAFAALDQRPGFPARRSVASAQQAWLPDQGGAALRPVWQLLITAPARVGRWEVLVDAASGQVVRVADLYPREVVQVLAAVDPDDPGGAPVQVAMPSWLTDADPDGRAQETAGPLSVGLSGPLVAIDDGLAATATHDFTVAGQASGIEQLVWPAGAAPQEQLDAWSYAHRAITYGRQVAPDLEWLARPLGVHVNFDDGSGFPYCNAFYLPRTFTDQPTRENIHFFRPGGNDQIQCINTATIPAVVMHEWGHGLHDHLLPAGLSSTFDEVQSSISEGVGDFVAASILDNPVMPTDKIVTAASPTQIPPRMVQNTLAYPGDLQVLGDGTPDVHWNGQIWSGTFWDLRTALEAKYGAITGRFMTDRLHADVLRGSPTWDSAYDLAIALDDDDDDPSNGAPDSCEINEAFAAHGLAPAPVPSRGSLDFHLASPATVEPGDSVQLTIVPRCGSFDPASVELRWSVAGGELQSLPMTAAGGGAFSATVPDSVSDGQVIEYQFAARTDDGALATWPADGSLLGAAVGSPTAVASWDFEDGGAGWAHGADSAPADDWEIGAPQGAAGDPDQAASGSAVAGTDLGDTGNGLYDPGVSQTWLESPPVACGDCRGLELRFHRWLALGPGDRAAITVGGQEVWHADGPLQDQAWTETSVDVSAAGDGQDGLTVRFTIQSDASTEAGGWNLDDVALVEAAAVGGGDGSGGNDLVGGCDAGGAAGGGSGTALVLLLLAGLGIHRRRRSGPAAG